MRSAARLLAERDARHLEVGDPRLLERRDPLLHVALGPAQRRELQQLVGDERLGLLLLAGEVELLDRRRLGLVAVAAGQLVVEVLALRAHAAHVERDAGPAELAQTDVTSSPVADRRGARRQQTCSGPSDASRFAAPSSSGAPQTSLRPLGDEEDREPAVGHLGGHRHVALAERRDPDRDRGADRVGDDLERLAEPGALAGGERQVVVAAMVLEGRLSAPHVPADLDDLARPTERRGVGDAVEALDHLGPGRAEAEVEASVAERVDARGRHREERRGARVDGQDRRADLDALGEGGEVAHEARAVEAVGLGDPHEVEPRGLHLDDLGAPTP